MDKQEVLHDYRTAYSDFRSSIAGLTEDEMTKPFLDGWSVREIVGHLVGWHEQMALGLERMARGERPTPEGVNWGDVQGFNDRFAAGVSGASPAQLIQDLDSKVAVFEGALRALPEDRFGEGKTANRMAAGAGYEHLREHTEEIKQARATGRL